MKRAAATLIFLLASFGAAAEESTGERIKEGAVDAAHAVEKGAVKAGQVIKKGAVEVGHAVEQGAHAVKRGAVKAKRKIVGPKKEEEHHATR